MYLIFCIVLSMSISAQFIGNVCEIVVETTKYYFTLRQLIKLFFGKLKTGKSNFDDTSLNVKLRTGFNLILQLYCLLNSP